MRKKMCLNQTYKREITFVQQPEVHKYFWFLDEYCKKIGYTIDNVTKGRLYDYALTLSCIPNLQDKEFCEVGARDSILGPILTKYGKVSISDNFKGWNELPGYDECVKIWKHAAVCPDQLYISPEDVLNLTYNDNKFDVVIALSLIGFLYVQKKDTVHTGDICGLKELIRICKSGGFIVLSVDMTDGNESFLHKGNYYYCIKDLYLRIINTPGCTLYGSDNFKFTEDNDAVTYVSKGNKTYKTSPAFLVLQVQK